MSRKLPSLRIQKLSTGRIVSNAMSKSPDDNTYAECSYDSAHKSINVMLQYCPKKAKAG